MSSSALQAKTITGRFLFATTIALFNCVPGTPAKAARNSIPKTSKTGNVTADQDCSSSEPNKSDDDLYTSLSSVETGQRRSLLGRAESATTEDQFEFVDAEDTEIQPGALVVVLSSDVRAEIFIPPIDDERCDFRHVEVSAGTRYVLPVLLGTKGTILCWKFSTSNQVSVEIWARFLKARLA